MAGLMRGWADLTNAKKWHYFTEDGRSLCGRWQVLRGRELADYNHDSVDNCAECRRRLAVLPHAQEAKE